MRNKYASNHVLLRDGIYYYLRRVPYDLTDHYQVKRLCFSLKTKSLSNGWPDTSPVHPAALKFYAVFQVIPVMLTPILKKSAFKGSAGDSV